METTNKNPNPTGFLAKYAKLIAVFVIILLLGSCNKTAVDPQPQDVAVEKVEPAFQDFLSQQEQVTLPLSTFILPNGQNAQTFYDNKIKSKGGRIEGAMAVSGPQEKKNILITEMIRKGNLMADRKSNVFTDVTPTQTGIAYSLGSKDYTVLQSPTQGSCNRDKKFHGIDCSGFVYQMASAAGLNLGNKLTLDAQRLSNPELWQNAIQAKGEEYKKIRVEDVSKEVNGQDSKLNSGDIIYFYDKSGARVHHIGLITKDAAGQIYFLNSFGNPEQNCESHFTRKGATVLSIKNKKWFDSGYNYGVLRITTDISGNWDVYIRCNGTSYDAIKYSLNFVTSKDDDKVTGQGSGIDYDGVSPVDVKFTGRYTRQDNILKGTLAFSFPKNPSGNREDSFEIKLNDDDTGYFTAKKVIDNGGCTVQIKLVNLEK